MAATMTRLNASFPLRSEILEVAAIFKQSQQQREVATAASENHEFKSDKSNNSGSSILEVQFWKFRAKSNWNKSKANKMAVE
ncbi:hypothetical protein AHAS_Ahas15G0222500 [Arachis hypogaea]